MGKKETKEAKESKDMEDKEKEPTMDEGDEQHSDVAQDEQLIKKMLDEYVGKDEEMDEESRKEMESLAREAYQAHVEMGGSETEAYERAGHALKLAKHMAGKQAKKEAADAAATQEATDKAAKDASTQECDDKEESKKESNADAKRVADLEAKLKEKDKELLAKAGELAALKETSTKESVRKYVDEKLAESKLSNVVTKQFREAAGEIKSKEDFDAKWKLFAEGLRGNRKGSTTLDWSVLTEKATDSGGSTSKGKGKKLDFSQTAE